jgi:hypothetical protein
MLCKKQSNQNINTYSDKQAQLAGIFFPLCEKIPHIEGLKISLAHRPNKSLKALLFLKHIIPNLPL